MNSALSICVWRQRPPHAVRRGEYSAAPFCCHLLQRRGAIVTVEVTIVIIAIIS
jgi:hypothetical protein